MSRNSYRFFAPQLPDDSADGAPRRVSLSAEESHHAARVLRLGGGEEVELFDGRGRLAVGLIAEIKRGEMVVDLQRMLSAAKRDRAAAHVAFAVPKGKRLDWLLEKATELGAASLQPILFDRSVAGDKELSASKRRRWQGHCIAAAKQSGANFLPDIHEPLRLEDFLAKLSVKAGGWLGLAGDLSPDAASLAEAMSQWSADQSIYLLVGPEGGLTGQERRAVAAGGFTPVRLGAAVLRIETAVVAMLAATLAFENRF